MHRRLSIVVVAVLSVVLAVQVGAQPPWVQPPGGAEPGFEGYWMGVDPVDGGDARRSLVRLESGLFALAARDSVLTLCDGTDRGFASFDDGVVTGRNVIQSNSLTIRCTNNGASVLLHVRYELIRSGLMAEVTTTPNGTPISTILFHRVSRG
jgi:hypothetical protein